jgi:hypothetical protein
MVPEFTQILEGVIREEWGGCHPKKDGGYFLKARVDHEAKLIEVFCVGKWRPIRFYAGKKAVPCARVIREVCNSVRINTGIKPEARLELKWE